MGTVSSLPADVLTTHVAKYSFRYPSNFDENLSRKWDFLGLRATCKLGADLMRRYVLGTLGQDWLNLQIFSPPSAISDVERWGADPADYEASARHVRAVGTVLGPACRALKAHGRSPEKIAALEYFVFRTNGHLNQLDLSHSHVSPDSLLRMCRLSPKLTELQGPRYVITPDATIVAISAACTDLKFVDFSQVGKNYSPAETWQRHFPGLNFLKLSHDSPRYLPTRLDVVREVALTRPQITGLDIGSCYVTARVIEAIVGTPLGDQLDEFGADDEVTVIEPAAFLAAARGFPELAHLVIPRESTMGGHAFILTFRARLQTSRASKSRTMVRRTRALLRLALTCAWSRSSSTTSSSCLRALLTQSLGAGPQRRSVILTLPTAPRDHRVHSAPLTCSVSSRAVRSLTI